MKALTVTAFWSIILVVGYVHAGYPLLMMWLARWKRRKEPIGRDASCFREVSCSVVLCVHDERDRVRARIRNLLGMEWPGRWELVLVCDGCTDDTAEQAQEEYPDVRVIILPVHSGKSAALNAGVRAATGEILVFCDVRQTFAAGAIMALTAPFLCETVGAVSGSLEIASSAKGGGGGIDAYWQMERRLRHWEGEYDSVVGCSGAIYACRRELYVEIPEDTLLDDVVIPMQVVVQGRRIPFASGARAFDPQPLSPRREISRKVRTLVGNYQMLFRHPEWLLPWRCRIWWQLLSHKYLRLAVPWLLLALLALSAALMEDLFYGVCLVMQLGFYTCAILGHLFPGLRAPCFTLPAGFVALQLANGMALPKYVTHRGRLATLWRKQTIQPNGEKEGRQHA